MKILVTGAGGFVGKHLLSALENSDYDAVGSDHKGRYDLELCDVTNKDQTNALIAKVRPDVIFHLAGYSSVPKSMDDSASVHEVNVQGTLNLLNACTAASITPKFILISSAHVYGNPKELPVDEDAPLSPQSPYAESRVEQEKEAQKFTEQNNIPLVIIRGFNQIGPGQSPDFVVSGIAKQITDIEAGEAQSLRIGNTEAKRDFTDVRDVVSAYILAIEKAQPGVYNVCSGESYAIQDVLDRCIKLADTDIRVEKDPDRMRASDLLDLKGDHSKFTAETGWMPTILIDTTLRNVLDYWRNH